MAAAPRTVDYLDNKNLLREIIRSQERQRLLPQDEQNDRTPECLTPELVTMMQKLVSNFATSYRWRGYTWIEDMQSEAVMSLCRVALKFDHTKAGEYPNPFGYYTQVVKRVFMNYVEKEKKQGTIRDDIIEMSGSDMLPSFARQHEGESNSYGIDLDGTRAVIVDPKLRRRRKKIKTIREDDTSEMSKPEYAQWLAAKISKFKTPTP